MASFAAQADDTIALIGAIGHTAVCIDAFPDLKPVLEPALKEYVARADKPLPQDSWAAFEEVARSQQRESKKEPLSRKDCEEVLAELRDTRPQRATASIADAFAEAKKRDEEIERLVEKGGPNRSSIGVSIGPASPPIISDVYEGSPAQLAGMKPGDAVVAVNGKSVEHHWALAKALYQTKPGDRVSLDVRRAGQKLKIDVVTSTAREVEEAATPRPGSESSIGVFVEAPSSPPRLRWVTPGSPAAAAGIKRGDIITSFNGKSLHNESSFSAAISATKPGEKVALEIERRGEIVKADVTTSAWRDIYGPLHSDHSDRQLPRSADDLEGFVPSGWNLEKVAEGDIDSDHQADLVFVIRQHKQKYLIGDPNSPTLTDRNPRIFAAALRRDDKYELVAQSRTLIPAATGKMKSNDPLAHFAGELAIADGVASLKLDGSVTLNFRFIEDSLKVVGWKKWKLEQTGEIEELELNLLSGSLRVAKANITRGPAQEVHTQILKVAPVDLDAIDDGTTFDPRTVNQKN